jgi:glycosyltransferase involved in cell wall biosynthesis
MNKPIHFTVIIPCFNAEATVQAAIDSVVSQTYSHKDLILVDGLSTDNTLAILKSNEANISLMISEKDSGVYDAINKGIKAAEGNIIFILGADDKLASDEILEHVAAHFTPEISMVYGHVRNIHIQNKAVPEVHSSSFSNLLYLKNTLHQQGCFYRKTLFEKELFNPEYKIFGDYDLHLKWFEEKILTYKLDQTIAICEASGLSKQVVWSLYKEELMMKRKRLSSALFLINCLWVPLKFIRKKISA